MDYLAGFFTGFIIGYGIRILYFTITKRDIPLYRRGHEIKRLRDDADRMEERR